MRKIDTCVELTNVVGPNKPLKYTLLPGWKPVPAIVNVPLEPLAADAGLTDEIVGTVVGRVSVKGCGDDVPPPGGGLTTATCTVPALAMAEAGIVAVST